MTVLNAILGFLALFITSTFLAFRKGKQNERTKQIYTKYKEEKKQIEKQNVVQNNRDQVLDILSSLTDDDFDRLREQGHTSLKEITEAVMRERANNKIQK